MFAKWRLLLMAEPRNSWSQMEDTLPVNLLHDGVSSSGEVESLIHAELHTIMDLPPDRRVHARCPIGDPMSRWKGPVALETLPTSSLDAAAPAPRTGCSRLHQLARRCM